jgi:hypothetical protein
MISLLIPDQCRRQSSARAQLQLLPRWMEDFVLMMKMVVLSYFFALRLLAAFYAHDMVA